MTVQQALNEFLLSKRLSGVGKNTIHNYDITISFLVEYIGADLPLEKLTYELVTQYILSLLDKPISKATKSSYIRNDKIFLRWIYTEYGLSFNPEKIKVPKSPKKNVHIYNDSEILTIFKTVSTSEPWITARNRCIIAFMLDSGLRQFEVCTMRCSDIDYERKIVKISGKGAKDRMVPLGDLTIYLLEEYRKICPYNDLGYVFYDRRGNMLSCNAIRLFVNRLEKKLGFSLSSHKLRHNFATNYCINSIKRLGNTNVHDLRVIMGHESIETTEKYEHFAHEMIAAENSISHLDTCLGNELKQALRSS